jgi:tripartite-type tricarboxylate transporter receptor subunit TctC
MKKGGTMSSLVRRGIAVMSFVATIFGLTPALAEENSTDFYRGKTITIYVGLPPGGTFDAYARLTAEYLSKFVPGQPNVIVQNMPGAGSLQAANYVYNGAPQDGTVIGAMSSNVPLQPLIDPRGVEYDLSKLNWLPTPAHLPNLMVVWHTSPIKLFDDLRKQEAVFGTLAPGSTPTVAIGLYAHVLGAKIRPVLGYSGLPAVMLAMEHGEVDGYSTMPFDTLQRTYGEQWKSGELRVLVQNDDSRLPELADVPTIFELAGSDDDRRLIGLATITTRMTLPYIMGPRVPESRVEIIRKAMEQVYADKSFLNDAAARNMTIAPVGSQQVEDIIRQAATTPPGIIEKLKELLPAQGR